MEDERANGGCPETESRRGHWFDWCGRFVAGVRCGMRELQGAGQARVASVYMPPIPALKPLQNHKQSVRRRSSRRRGLLTDLRPKGGGPTCSAAASKACCLLILACVCGVCAADARAANTRSRRLKTRQRQEEEEQQQRRASREHLPVS